MSTLKEDPWSKDKTGHSARAIEIAFFACFFTLFLLFFVFFSLDPTGGQANVFFLKTNNFMADFFNIAKYSVDRYPYLNQINGRAEKAYLPLTYIVFRLLARFTEYKGKTAFEAGFSTMGSVTAFFFLFLISSALFIVLYQNRKGSAVAKMLTCGSLVLSGIFLFSFERGNIIILTAALAAFFIFYRKSTYPIVREVSYLCLAVAACLKGYPALLGLVLVYERKYREAMRLAAYGILFGFLPFLLLDGGFSNVGAWLFDVRENNREYLLSAYPRFGHLYFLSYFGKWLLRSRDLPLDLERIHRILQFVVYGLSAVLLFLSHDEGTQWKKIAALVCVILIVPVNSGLYCGLYMFPVVVLYLSDPHKTKKDIFYVLSFLLFLNPLQIVDPHNDKKNFTLLLINLSVCALFADLFLSNLLRRIRKIQNVPLIKGPRAN